MMRWWTTKEKNFWTYLAISKAVPATFWNWFQKLKTNLDFQRIFSENFSCTISHFQNENAFTIFLAIYRKSKFFQKNFMALFYGWGSTVSRLQSQYEETVYFLPVSSQECLELISSIFKGWKVESTLEPFCDFELGNPGLGIQRLNH